jgi:hypothetical protein
MAFNYKDGIVSRSILALKKAHKIDSMLLNWIKTLSEIVPLSWNDLFILSWNRYNCLRVTPEKIK